MLIIFDWDGTILDSTAKIVQCMQVAALDCSHEPLPDAAILAIIGLELTTAIGQLYPGLSAVEVAQVREAYSQRFVEADQRPCELFPGVELGLRLLRKDGHDLCVATGKSRRGLDRVFERSSVSGLFSASRCADETASKPHPLMLEELCYEFSTPARKALMVGDTAFDLEMAHRLGMPSVGVSYGAHPVAELVRWEPRAVIDRFDDLLPLVSAMGKIAS